MYDETADTPDMGYPGQDDAPLSSDTVEEMAYMRQDLSDTRRTMRLDAETLTSILLGLDPRHPGFRDSYTFVARDLRNLRHVLSALEDVEREQERARFPDRAAPLRAALRVPSAEAIEEEIES